ncbi:unnamed protein product, partial [Phaeothamnion confervicola]
VVVYRDPPVVHVFEVVEHGRRFFRSLCFSSDASLSLHEMAPVGVMDDDDAGAHLVAGEVGGVPDAAPSLVVTRTLYQSVGPQKFVPERLLRGVLPAALLQQFLFWQ